MAFRWLGLAYLVVGLIGAALLVAPAVAAGTKTKAAGDLTTAQALRTPQWYLLTAMLMLAVMAGISLISMMAGAAVDVGGFSPAAAAGIVGVLALFNGGGRVAWAAVAEKLGRLRVLAIILALEGVALLLLPHSQGFAFLALAGVVYLCYGGAFGVLPSTAGQFFGLSHAGAIYGLMLVGWSAGGVLGPLLAAGLVGDSGAYTRAFSVIGALAVAAVVLPLITRPVRKTA